MKNWVLVLVLALILAAPIWVQASMTATGTGSIQERQLRQEWQQKREESRAEFRLKLTEIKDERRKNILARLNERVCEINKNRMENMDRHLDKMDSILDRVVTRTSIAKSEGLDTGSAEQAAKNARDKVTEARTAVDVQAEKPCDLMISGGEKNLGGEVSGLIRRFRQDVAGGQDKVVSARKAGSFAIQSLARIVGEKIAPSTTPTPNP